MAPQTRIPKSFKEVADSNLWMTMRHYKVKQIQEQADITCHASPFELLSGTISAHGPSQRNCQAAGRDSHLSDSINIKHDRPRQSQQPLPIPNSISFTHMPSPAPSTPDRSISRVPSFSQNNSQSEFAVNKPAEHVFTPLVTDLPATPQEGRGTVWDNSQQPTLTFPVPQHASRSNGIPWRDSPLQQVSPDTSPNVRYRLTLGPILVNGEVQSCWYLLPKIAYTSVEQFDDQIQASATQLLEPPTPRVFQPTKMLLERNGVRLPISYCQLSSEIKHHYRGDPTSAANRRLVYQLPDAHNCTLWLWNIPVTLHVSELFDQIDTGAVQCCHIVPPNESHSTCAAKLAFMAPDAAANFKQKTDSEDGVWLQGTKLMARYNRDGNLRNDTQQSRILAIEGPNDLMTLNYWEAYFQKICVYQFDRVLEFPCQDPGKKVLQFSFVRLDGQAQACMGAIQTQAEFVGIVRASFMVDQCGNQAVRDYEKQCRRLY